MNDTLDSDFDALYPIEKALFHLNGGNCSKERVEKMLRCISIKERRVISCITSYLNNSFFDSQSLYNWMLWRYVVTGLDTFPDIKEIDPKIISKHSKELYKNKKTADMEFLNLLCGKVGKDIRFVNELNTVGESHLFRLFKAEKIGIAVLMDLLEPNKQNKEQNNLYLRITKIKTIITKKYTGNKND